MLTKEFLEQEYWGNWKTVKQIAIDNGLKFDKVRRLMEKFQIRKRTNGQAQLPKEAIVNDKVRWCNMCKQNLPISEFTKCKAGRNGINSNCRKCRAKKSKSKLPELNQKKWINKAKLVMEFGNKCSKCGAKNLPLSCYDFHHKNPGEKEFNIATTLYFSNAKTLKEVREKCIMVCSNCHRIIHNGDKKASDYLETLIIN